MIYQLSYEGSQKRQFPWELVLSYHLFRDYGAQGGNRGQESSKEVPGSEGCFSHKGRAGSDISSSRTDFPSTELGVTPDRPSRVEMLLFILKLFAVYQENNIFFPFG